MPGQNTSAPVPEGRIEKLTDGYAVAFDRQLDYPKAHIWDILTNPEKIPLWQIGRAHV